MVFSEFNGWARIIGAIVRRNSSKSRICLIFNDSVSKIPPCYPQYYPQIALVPSLDTRASGLEPNARRVPLSPTARQKKTSPPANGQTVTPAPAWPAVRGCGGALCRLLVLPRVCRRAVSVACLAAPPSRPRVLKCGGRFGVGVSGNLRALHFFQKIGGRWKNRSGWANFG